MFSPSSSPLFPRPLCQVDYDTFADPGAVLLGGIKPWQADLMRLEFPVEKSQRDFWTHYQVCRCRCIVR